MKEITVNPEILEGIPVFTGSQVPIQAMDLAGLFDLSAASQGDIDLSLIQENLRLTPEERFAAAARVANDLAQLREAWKAKHG